MRRGTGYVLLLGAIGTLVIACNTVQGPVPELPVTYYSPYLSSGALTEWAAAAVERGIGSQLYPNVMEFPDNRVLDDGVREWKVNKARKSERIVAERSANLCGGWDFISKTSDKEFNTVDALAADLFARNVDDVRYAQALAATMMIYPELRSKYYIVNYGGWREQIKVR